MLQFWAASSVTYMGQFTYRRFRLRISSGGEGGGVSLTPLKHSWMVPVRNETVMRNISPLLKVILVYIH